MTVNPVAQHFWGRLKIEKATAFLHFKKQSMTQDLIHKLKYENRVEIGLLLGRIAAEELIADGFFKGIDLIVPVPMHQTKQKKRGYNQAEVIAKGVAEQSGIAMASELLVKAINTETQTKKSRALRFQNVKDSYALKNSQQIEADHLLLIDDVITTGSTLEACATILKDALDCRLSILTLAATD
jgi:ComF family protein